MLNKITTFAFALLLAANVEAMRLESAGKSHIRAQQDATKDGYVVKLGESQYDETTGTAIVGVPALYDTSGNEISSGGTMMVSVADTQDAEVEDAEEGGEVV